MADLDAFVSVHVEAAVVSGDVVRPTLATTFDHLTYQYLASLAVGGDADLVGLQVAPGAKGSSSAEAGTIVYRPLGTGLTTSGYVFLMSPTYYTSTRFISSSLLMAVSGTGLTTSAITLDSRYFSPTYLTTYKTSSLTLLNMTMGTGLTTSAIIWNSYYYAPSTFQLSGTLSKLTVTYGTGLTTSGYVFYSPYMTSLVNYTLTPSLTTIRAMSIESADDESISGDVEDLYEGATVPGELSLARQYEELSVRDGSPGSSRADEKRPFENTAGKRFPGTWY